MSPIHEDHDFLSRYAARLLEAYFEVKPIGQIRQAPFAMKISRVKVSREPDLQVILNTNPGNLTPTYMDGPADICIEIVSPESVTRDHGEKFEEYEKGGVPEYWLIDPQRQQAEFYQRGADGIYRLTPADDQGLYRSRMLDGLWLKADWLWQRPLPSLLSVLKEWRLI